jgi:hypothetical protein
MRRRVWLIALCLYALAGIADGAYRASEALRATAEPPAATILVAFCAGLFWPLDVAARVLLAQR